MITVLSGGVGAARLLSSLRNVIDPLEVTAIVNVGDDLVLHGLTICPDLDTITYTLAGLHNDEQGWGLRGETWRVMKELEALGGVAWFGLGDRDLATHLYRSQRLHDGATKTQVTAELCASLGVTERLLPITNDVIGTEFITPLGRLSFQEYFVRHHHDVDVSSVVVVGAREARATNEALDALSNATRIVIAPSNPLISIDPILQIPSVRSLIASRRDDVVAVSPIVNGVALKGPAGRLLESLGYESSCVGVADFYEGLVGTWIIDETDAHHEPALRARDVNVVVTTTVMSNVEHAARLAHAVLV